MPADGFIMREAWGNQIFNFAIYLIILHLHNLLIFLLFFWQKNLAGWKICCNFALAIGNKLRLQRHIPVWCVSSVG